MKRSLILNSECYISKEYKLLNIEELKQEINNSLINVIHYLKIEENIKISFMHI